MPPLLIERIGRDASPADVRALGALLVDAVEGGAGVSFVTITQQEAEAWWRKTLASSDAPAIFLVARDEAGIAGTVQMQPAWAPNQRHRGDIVKLMVHRRARRQGIARALMAEIERAAAAAGFTLLLLDTCKGYDAERLYASTGWTRVGEVPGFAFNPDGSPCDSVFFFKKLAINN